jgi:hypothetical protein
MTQRWLPGLLVAALTLTSCSGKDASPSDGAASADVAVGVPETGADAAVDRPVDRTTPPDMAAVDTTQPGVPDARVDTVTVQPPPDGNSTFNPCPPAGMPCRIMPLGDSITHGIGSSDLGGYRVPLFRKARMANKSLTFVGSIQNGPATVDGVPFPPQHEGHRMHIIDTANGRAGISPLVPAAIATHKPHIVTLMIGTNDAYFSTAPEAPQRLGELIDKIVVADPNVLIVVATLIPQFLSPSGTQAAMTINSAIPGVVAARAAAQKHVVLVDMYQAFVSVPDYRQTLMGGDTLHPNDAGFETMAAVWWVTVGPLLR